MKNKHFIILFVFGFILLIIGSLMKIQHLEFGPITADVILVLGLAIKWFTGMFFLIKIARNNKEWLNK